MKVLVLGASLKSNRYSFQAVKDLVKYGHEVKAIGNREGELAGIKIEKGLPLFDQIDTVTLYLNPFNQKGYYDYIISLSPRRVIFNPGTENNDFEERLNNKGIICEIACTLVLLRTNQF